jgi:hypothetical protein
MYPLMVNQNKCGLSEDIIRFSQRFSFVSRIDLAAARG